MPDIPSLPTHWEFYVLDEVPNFILRVTHYTPASHRTQHYTFDDLKARAAHRHDLIVDLLADGWEPVTEWSFKRAFADE